MKRLLLLPLAITLACGDDSAAPDAAVDASTNDAVLTDAGPADTSLELDSGVDASSSDSGPSDSGGGDAAVPDVPWAWCPSSADFVGDATWTDRIVVSDVVWCVMADEGRTLQEDMAGKAQLWVATGEYAFPPREEATGEMTLPFCINTPSGQGPMLSGNGAFEVSVGEYVSEFLLTNTLDDGSEFLINTYIERNGDMPVPWPGGGLDSATIRGGFQAPGTASGSMMYGHRLGDCAGDDEWNETTVNATFDAGNVEFSFRAIAGSVSTGPSGGFRAQGTLDGVDFDVDDYFRIFYAAEHHHFGGQYAVFFDEPIRGACGLRVNNNYEERSLSLIDCDLATLETIEDATIVASYD